MYGLDFSEEEEEEEEEIIVKTEIPPEDRNPKISEYQSMFDMFKEDNDEALSDDYSDEDIEYEDNYDDEDSSDYSEDDDTPPFEVQKEEVKKVEKKAVTIQITASLP